MGKIKRWFRNLPLRVSFMVYMLVWLLTATFLTSLLVSLFSNTRMHIIYSYAVDDFDHFYSLRSDGTLSLYDPDTDDYLVFQLSERENLICHLMAVLQSLTLPVVFLVCIILAGVQFYRSKLKIPIQLLDHASQKIRDNDLDFHLSYDRTDEMGRLCDSFETMRRSLFVNNQTMWRQMEERKRLNAAFSHDLRTPLTVLKGHTDMLVKYLPSGKLSEQKMWETAKTMSAHIARLERYVNAMNQLQKLEDIDVQRACVPRASFVRTLEQSACILCSPHDLRFTDHCACDTLYVDAPIVLQVCENLLSNAARYAAHDVEVTCSLHRDALCITVCDDGPGFSSQDLLHAAKPFYKSDTSADNPHFGLGLYICSLLCQRHGGALSIANGPAGGACLQAVFAQRP